jgi:hypothetical protein
MTVDSQIAGFLEKYTPSIRDQLRDARAQLRAYFPRGFELVFDNYNALVFAISATERPKDAFVSVAGYPKWITLFFRYGAELDDPHGLLEGTGKQVRSIRLKQPDDLNSAAVAALIRQASSAHESSLERCHTLSTVVCTVVAGQRPRRPAKAKQRSVRKKTRNARS